MSFPAEDISLSDMETYLCEKRLADFVRISWPILNPTTPFDDSYVIDAVSDHVQAVIEGQIENLLANIAPRMSKSTIASICLTPWTWGPAGLTSMSFVYVSYGINLASDHSVKARRLIDSSWYQERWGTYRLTSDQNEKMKFENSLRGVRAAFGMGAVAGQGGDVVVIDDPHDTKDWTSPAKIKATISTYDSSIHNRVNNPTRAKRILIAQRIANNDLSGHLLGTGEWEYLMIPTEYDPKRSKVTVLDWKDPRQRPGQLASEGRYGKREVELEKRVRPRTFNAQHQQNPTEDETAIFKRSAWRFYQERPHEIVDKMEVVIQSWDLTTGSDSPGTSKNAGQVWGRVGAFYVLLDRVHDYMNADQILQAMRNMSKVWPQARMKIVENKAAGPIVISLLKKEIPGILPFPPEGMKLGGKVERAQAIQPYQASGNILLPSKENCSWVDEYVEYMTAFPEGEFDDDSDCTAQAILTLEKPHGGKPEGSGTGTKWLRSTK